MGLDVHRYFPGRDIERRRLSLLRRLGVSVVIDGGANQGQWAGDLRRGGYPGLIVSFEPVSYAFSKLEAAAAGDPLWRCVKAALGDHDGEADINVAGNSVSSSLLPMARAHLDAAPESAYVGVESVPVVRLDRVVSEYVAPSARLGLKLDLQGFEMQALEGAGGILSDVEFVESELSAVPLYKGQALCREMMARLDELGFDLASLDEEMIDTVTGQVLQLNGTFARRPAQQG